MRFSNMEDFHLGYQFFMTRPSRGARNFILTVAGVIIAAVAWAGIAQMEDVVQAAALLRPVETISTVRPLTGGQVRVKNYVQNGLVEKGDLLLQLDTSSDVLELRNSKELMARINNGLLVHTALLETIRLNVNAAPRDNGEAYIHSAQFILENRHQQLQVAEKRMRLENERNLPEAMVIRVRLDELALELERAELRLALWRNGRTVESTDMINVLTQQRENLERRISDLERNIGNATIYAPISGRVNELCRLNVGDNVIPGEEILAIVPEGETGLRVELHVDPVHIARIRPGQTVVLRFPGLPPSRYGKMETEIALIPADVSAVHGPAPVFILEALLKEPWLVSRGGEKAYLRAGIGASARIVIDRDTVLRMLLRRLDFIGEN